MPQYLFIGLIKICCWEVRSTKQIGEIYWCILSPHCCPRSVLISRVYCNNIEVFYINPNRIIFFNDFIHFVIIYTECNLLSSNLFCNKMVILYVVWYYWSLFYLSLGCGCLCKAYDVIFLSIAMTGAIKYTPAPQEVEPRALSPFSRPMPLAEKDNRHRKRSHF